jgi:lipopolysaccharide/colanic/teichoic acid biosynthesis glycosyltransferase
MSDNELRERLMDRYLSAQTPWGRWKLRFRIRVKLLAWEWVTRGAFILKRLLDIVVSAMAILLLIPVYAVLAILVKMDGGPVFLKQPRVGFKGREFIMYKYRTMVVNADEVLKGLLSKNEMRSGVVFKMSNDPRITKIGRFLRASSLDELPQFWNVLKGDMSLVGPRPPIPREVARYSQSDRRRFLAKPGLTCLWQVGERRGGLFEIGDRLAIDFPEQVDLDVRYIECQGFWKDLWILMKTIPAILFGKVMSSERAPEFEGHSPMAGEMEPPE